MPTKPPVTFSSATAAPYSKPAKAPQWSPLPFQPAAIEFLISHGAAGLLLPPGSGKTSICLTAYDIVRRAKKREGVRKMLVAAPKNVIEGTWPDELMKWRDFQDYTFTYLHGPQKEALARLDVDIYGINYEGLPWLCDSGLLREMNIDILVYDEIQRQKNTQTQRYRAMEPWLGTFRYRWGLTGSPASEHLLDLYGICYSLDLGGTLGGSYVRFRRSYFLPAGYGGQTFVPKPGAAKALAARTKDLLYEVNAHEHLLLPELKVNNIRLKLEPAAQKQIDQIEYNFLLEVAEGKVKAANAAVLGNKLRQAYGGAIYLQKEVGVDREWRELHRAKMEALRDLLETLGDAQVLILFEYDHEGERIAKEFKVPIYKSGPVGVEMKRQWNAGKIRRLGAQSSAVALGLNLQESSAQHIIWFTLPWSFGTYDQCIYRLRRQGSKALWVRNHRIMVRDSIDERVANVLAGKKRTQETFVEALRDYAGEKGTVPPPKKDNKVVASKKRR